jgi:hypothetical protein
MRDKRTYKIREGFIRKKFIGRESVVFSIPLLERGATRYHATDMRDLLVYFLLMLT